MAAKSESVKAEAPGWSWSRAREAVVVMAVVAGFGVLIAGVTYAVQPVREDMRVLQTTM